MFEFVERNFGHNFDYVSKLVVLGPALYFLIRVHYLQWYTLDLPSTF